MHTIIIQRQTKNKSITMNRRSNLKHGNRIWMRVQFKDLNMSNLLKKASNLNSMLLPLFLWQLGMDQG
jgi:hypothetical protein